MRRKFQKFDFGQRRIFKDIQLFNGATSLIAFNLHGVMERTSKFNYWYPHEHNTCQLILCKTRRARYWYFLQNRQFNVHNLELWEKCCLRHQFCLKNFQYSIQIKNCSVFNWNLRKKQRSSRAKKRVNDNKIFKNYLYPMNNYVNYSFRRPS